MQTQKRLVSPKGSNHQYGQKFLRAVGASDNISVKSDGDHFVVKSTNGAIPERIVFAIEAANQEIRAPEDLKQQLYSGWKRASNTANTMFSSLSEKVALRLARNTARGYLNQRTV